MRWIPLIIVAYVMVLLQTTLGRILMIHHSTVGAVSPDLVALVAVFVALTARSGLDVMLAGWILGLGLDLTTGAGIEASTVVGPMPIAYALAGGILYGIREAFFRDRVLTQALLALLFCLLAHGLWVVLQSLLGYRGIGWSELGRVLLQAAMLSVYTALLMPLGGFLLKKIQRFLILQPSSGRSR